MYFNHECISCIFETLRRTPKKARCWWALCQKNAFLFSQKSEMDREHPLLAPRHSLLSDTAVKRNIQDGRIVIVPFEERNLSSSSYDVTLGPYYYTETPTAVIDVFNPYSQKDVQRVWGEAKKAEMHAAWSKRHGGHVLENIPLDAEIIWLHPGETILAHTQEFIGGRESITTMMKTRSSMGRSFVATCKCAGWGDVGYVNRWTMEITNNSEHHMIPLVVGRRIAQIVFFETEGVISTASSYENSGKYQSSYVKHKGFLHKGPTHNVICAV